jgi:hypothetical protein
VRCVDIVPRMGETQVQNFCPENVKARDLLGDVGVEGL